MEVLIESAQLNCANSSTLKKKQIKKDNQLRCETAAGKD